MPNNETDMHLTPDPNPPEATESPTITQHQLLAAAFMSHVDALVAMIPKLEVPHSATKTFVIAHLNIPNPFLATVTSAVEQEPALQTVDRLDPAWAREILQFLEAFRPALDKLTALRDSLEFTLWSRKAVLASSALQVYGIAQQLARAPRATTIAAQVTNMRRDFGRRGRPRLRA
jgi:hypothetical protein